MPLVYITGVEGAGKSTVCQELLQRGYQAIDIDAAGLTHRYVKGGWEQTDNLPARGESTAEWFQAREWKIQPSTLQKLRAEAGDKIVFVCGITDNFDEIKDTFDRIICLQLAEHHVRHRLTTRNNNSFGKHESELSYILDKHPGYEARAQQASAVMIDASQPLEQEIDAILAAAKS